MTAVLLCRTGDDAGLVHRIVGGRCLIGRAEECDLAATDAFLSRRHALIREVPDGAMAVEDLGSRHGTTLNGQALTARDPVQLTHLDVIGTGPLEQFVYLELERVACTQVLAASLVGPDGARAPLQLGTNTIGSDSDADLIVMDGTVPPIVGRLQLSAAGVKLEPVASYQVPVNGVEGGVAALKDGDVVRLGRVDFEVEIVTGLGAPESDSGYDSSHTVPVDEDLDASLAETSAASRPPQLTPRDADRPTLDPATDSLPEDVKASLKRAYARHERARAQRADRSATGVADLDTSALGRRVGSHGPGDGSLRRTWGAKSPEGLPKRSAPQAVRREAAARLHFVLPETGESRVVLLREGRHLVGRLDTCRAWIGDLSVSREHAEVRVGSDGVTVEDLGSANGTYVGRDRLPESKAVKVPVKQRIRFGSVEAWFEVI